MTTTFNALFLGAQNYLSVTDANGHLERIQLTPEDIEHIVLAVDIHKVCAEQARAEVDAREESLGLDYDPTDAELGVA